MKWSELMILGEMCVLSLVYGYVAVCRFCVVRCGAIICFCFLFTNYLTYVFLILFLCIFFVLYFCFIFCVFCVFVLCCVFLLLCFLFPIFIQVYRPLPPGGNLIAVHKYHNNNHNHNHHIIPDLITQIIFRDECRSWRFSLSVFFLLFLFLFPSRLA